MNDKITLYTTNNIKEKTDVEKNLFLNHNIVLSANCFEWKSTSLNFYEILLLEKFLCLAGNFAIYNNNGVYMLGFCEFGGELYEFGLGNIAIFNRIGYYGKKEKPLTFQINNWLDNENIVICFNNSQFTGEDMIDNISMLQKECNKSIKCNIINSRYHRIIGCNNDKDRIAVDNCLNKIADGVPCSVTLNNPLNQLLDNTTDPITVYDITDVTKQDKIQYLSQLNENLERRIYTHLGFNVTSNNKMAQMNRKELLECINAIRLYNNDRLNMRKTFIDILKDKNFSDFDISVDFSEILKNEYNNDNTDDVDTDELSYHITERTFEDE